MKREKKQELTENMLLEYLLFFVNKILLQNLLPGIYPVINGKELSQKIDERKKTEKVHGSEQYSVHEYPKFLTCHMNYKDIGGVYCAFFLYLEESTCINWEPVRKRKNV
jgi:hypothetical protein